MPMGSPIRIVALAFTIDPAVGERLGDPGCGTRSKVTAGPSSTNRKSLHDEGDIGVPVRDRRHEAKVVREHGHDVELRFEMKLLKASESCSRSHNDLAALAGLMPAKMLVTLI